MSWDRLLQVDRRIIFVLMGLAVIVPLATRATIDPGESPPTRQVYDFVEGLKPGSVLVIVFDYGPASMPELSPMASALARHGLRRGLRVVGMTLQPDGAVLAGDLLSAVGKDLGKIDGTDYVNLGYKPGGSAVVLQMATNIGKAFEADFQGRPYDSLPITRGLRTYRDIGLIVDLGSSDSARGLWIPQAHERYDVPVAAGITAVMATDLYPFLQTKQLVGLLNGMKGAAEYEKLINHRGSGMMGMVAQSVAQFVIILFVAFGNLVYFMSRRRAASA